MSVTMEQVVTTCVMTPRSDPFDLSCIWGLPLNIKGLSGCGKTERIGQVCRALKLPLFTILLSSKQPEDFGGAPFLGPDGIVVECILSQVNRLREIGYGVLFFDEFNTARPAVQAPCLGAINERRIGDHLLPPKVRTLAAMNPIEYATGGFELHAALSNRLMHVDYTPPSAADWADFMTGRLTEQAQAVADSEQKVLQNWNDQWSHMLGLMTSFIQANPALLHDQPRPEDPKSGGPWPSHRMWNWAGRAIAASRCLGMPSSIEPIIITGCVGEGVLPEWVEWMAKADLPSPQDILAGRWHPDKRRLDITIAALNSVTVWVQNLKDSAAQKRYATATWGVIKEVIDEGMSDIATKAASALVSSPAHLGHDSDDATLADAAKPVLLHLSRSGYTRFAQVLT